MTSQVFWYFFVEKVPVCDRIMAVYRKSPSVKCHSIPLAEQRLVCTSRHCSTHRYTLQQRHPVVCFEIILLPSLLWMARSSDDVVFASRSQIPFKKWKSEELTLTLMKNGAFFKTHTYSGECEHTAGRCSCTQYTIGPGQFWFGPQTTLVIFICFTLGFVKPPSLNNYSMYCHT